MEVSLVNLKNSLCELEISTMSDLVLLGDMNIDYGTVNASRRKLCKFLKSFNLENVITAPTRVTLHSATLIDHIYCNNPGLYNHRGVLDPGLSDHCMIFVCRKRKRVSREKTSVRIRNYRHFDAHLF